MHKDRAIHTERSHRAPYRHCCAVLGYFCGGGESTGVPYSRLSRRGRRALLFRILRPPDKLVFTSCGRATDTPDQMNQLVPGDQPSIADCRIIRTPRRWFFLVRGYRFSRQWRSSGAQQLHHPYDGQEEKSMVYEPLRRKESSVSI